MSRQQPDLRELRQLRLRKSEVSAERRDVHGDLQAVAVRGDVFLAKARDPHGGVGVAHDALHHVAHDLLDALDLEALSQADVAHEVVHQARGMLDRGLGARHLFLDTHPVDVGLDLYAWGQQLRAGGEFLRRLAWKVRGRFRRLALVAAFAARQSPEEPAEESLLVCTVPAGLGAPRAIRYGCGKAGDTGGRFVARPGGRLLHRLGRRDLRYVIGLGCSRIPRSRSRRLARDRDRWRRRRFELVAGRSCAIDDHVFAVRLSARICSWFSTRKPCRRNGVSTHGRSRSATNMPTLRSVV
jgi:hypothetical protein